MKINKKIKLISKKIISFLKKNRNIVFIILLFVSIFILMKPFQSGLSCLENEEKKALCIEMGVECPSIFKKDACFIPYHISQSVIGSLLLLFSTLKIFNISLKKEGTNLFLKLLSFIILIYLSTIIIRFGDVIKKSSWWFMLMLSLAIISFYIIATKIEEK